MTKALKSSCEVQEKCGFLTWKSISCSAYHTLLPSAWGYLPCFFSFISTKFTNLQLNKVITSVCSVPISAFSLNALTILSSYYIFLKRDEYVCHWVPNNNFAQLPYFSLFNACHHTEKKQLPLDELSLCLHPGFVGTFLPWLHSVLPVSSGKCIASAGVVEGLSFLTAVWSDQNMFV